MSSSLSRRDELAGNLARVQARIDAACAEAGRDPAGVTLVVVTKYFPASDVRLLDGLGVRHVGENRHQEAEAKEQECEDLGLTWHFIGGLQSNKAAAVARYARVIESVDRLKLVPHLDRGADDGGRAPTCLVQVNLDPAGGSGRNGADPADVIEIASAIKAAPRLKLGGVMAVAPLGEDPDPAFARLAEVSARLREVHPGAKIISAGMSGDLEQAVKHGATHVRVGSAVLGSRPLVQ